MTIPNSLVRTPGIVEQDRQMIAEIEDAGTSGEGLMFVAFGKTLDAFVVQLRRMVGLEDGIPDALFRFSRAISGAY